MRASPTCALGSTYDHEHNPLIDLETSVLGPMLDRYSPGLALDAACGTGRWAAYLSQRGHTVRGVDQSPQMLEVARRRLPDVEFIHGDLERLPVPDTSIDLVVCALAMTHLAALGQHFGSSPESCGRRRPRRTGGTGLVPRSRACGLRRYASADAPGSDAGLRPASTCRPESGATCSLLRQA